MAASPAAVATAANTADNDAQKGALDRAQAGQQSSMQRVKILTEFIQSPPPGSPAGSLQILLSKLSINMATAENVC